ncbi:MAG TPA: DNA gyrase modulator, partial [Verrucomicrobiae bacterium]|nr:DNA gyrase modulator [Verrucomicrobiae bacterium]
MLDQQTYAALIARALRRGGQFADVFCERRHTTTYRLQDGRVHEGSRHAGLGAGIRVIADDAA